jgi:hypothetical protein
MIVTFLQYEFNIFVAKPGKHLIAVDTVDLQQTTSLESATTSLTPKY